MIPEDSLSLLDQLLAKAKAAGAEAADAVLVQSAGLSQAVRLGEPERLEREESGDLGLRVLIGRRQAMVSTSDLGREAVGELVERAVAMARAVPEDRFCGLAEPGQLAGTLPDLELEDSVEATPEELRDRAQAAEEAARAVQGITNSEGGEAGWGRSAVALAASNGFRGGYAVTGHSISVSVIAGAGDAMQRDYDYARTSHAEDLPSPEEIGRRAAERTLARLNPQKLASARLPVVFDPRIASSLLGHLAGAINGQSVARGTSFLKDSLGEALFPEGVSVIDDPLRRRGHRSRPFDGEGLATQRRHLVEAGRLATWILDLATARQLGLASTGNASRGTSAPPSPSASNLYFSCGPLSPEELMADIAEGLYVTELMGMGVNGVTGDYSRGAAGFRIARGELAEPVAEVTIAGNLKDMFRRLTPADDLVFRTGVDSPTLRVDGMTVAGR